MNIKNLLNHVWRKPESDIIESKQTELSNLAHLYVLYSDSHRHCDTCPNESEHCRKLHFSNCTICVVPCNQVVTFGKKNRVSKPSPKI